MGIRGGKFDIHVIEDSHVHSEWDFSKSFIPCLKSNIARTIVSSFKKNPAQGILIHKVLCCEALMRFAKQHSCQKKRSKAESTYPHLHPNTHLTITRAASLRLHTESVHPFSVLHTLPYHIVSSTPSIRVKCFSYQLLSVFRWIIQTEKVEKNCSESLWVDVRR